MKFQDSSFNGLKVTVGTKSVTHARTHPRTHAPKAICPINFFKVGGIISHTSSADVSVDRRPIIVRRSADCRSPLIIGRCVGRPSADERPIVKFWD